MTGIPVNAYLMIIGAMKCGTTSLFGYLAAHPQICPSKIKEPEFFSEHQAHAISVEKYADLWNFDPERHRYVMEASTGYTKYPFEAGVAGRIYDFGLKPKFIYIVRNPFDRIESHFNYMLKYGGGLNHALTSDHYVSTSDYYLQLEQYRKYFPKSSLLVIDFNDLKHSPREVVSRVCRFLELDDFSPEHFNVANRTSTVSKAEYLLSRLPLHRFAGFLPERVRGGVRDVLSRISPEVEPKRLSAADREYICKQLTLNMGKLDEEYGIDVAQWGF